MLELGGIDIETRRHRVARRHMREEERERVVVGRENHITLRRNSNHCHFECFGSKY
jgi:hypothetical protein